MAKRDYYEILGVSKNSDAKEIKKAYREMVMTYHPDKMVHLGEEQAQEAHLKFLEIMEAYKELESDRAI